MSYKFKSLIGIFSLAVLSGCATLNETDTSTCVLKKGTSLNVLFLSFSNRNDEDNEACRASRAATVIANMRKKDGSPDMQMYNFAANMYRESSPAVREFMDKMLKENGMSIEAVRFEVQKSQEPVSCERLEVQKPDGTTGTSFKCKKL